MNLVYAKTSIFNIKQVTFLLITDVCIEVVVEEYNFNTYTKNVLDGK